MSSPEPLTIDIFPVVGRKVWPLFAPHHYLTGKYAGHRAWLAVLPDGSPVAFASIIAAPSGHFRNGWRGHRTVVLPDFQGLGFGARLSDWVGEYVITTHTHGVGRYFSRTMHPRLAAHRDASPLWKATSSNGKSNSGTAANRMGLGVDGRASFSHEYIGRPDPVADLIRHAKDADALRDAYRRNPSAWTPAHIESARYRVSTLRSPA